MAIIFAQLLLGLLGLLFLVRDSVALGQWGAIRGRPRRVIAVLLLLPFPVTVLALRLLAAQWAAPNGSIDIFHFILLELVAWSILFLCMGAAWLVGVQSVVSDPPRQGQEKRADSPEHPGPTTPQ